MVLLVKLFSIIVMLMGSLLVLRPSMLKKVVEYVRDKNRVTVIGVVRIVVGIILLVAASYCSIPWIVRLFGGLILLGGILVFLLKKNFQGRIMEWLESRKKKHVITIGGVVLALGIILILAS